MGKNSSESSYKFSHIRLGQPHTNTHLSNPSVTFHIVSSSGPLKYVPLLTPSWLPPTFLTLFYQNPLIPLLIMSKIFGTL